MPLGLNNLPTLSKITVSGIPTAFFENLPKVVLELYIKKFSKLDILPEEKKVLGYLQAMLEQKFEPIQTPGETQGYFIVNHHFVWIGIPNELVILPSALWSLPNLRKVQIGSKIYEIAQIS